MGVGQTVLFADVECQNGMVDVLINAGTPQVVWIESADRRHGPLTDQRRFSRPADCNGDSNGDCNGHCNGDKDMQGTIIVLKAILNQPVYQR